MAIDSIDVQEPQKITREYPDKSPPILQREYVSQLVPPDLEASIEDMATVERVVNSWKEDSQHSENAFAKELVTSLFRRVDGWIPGNETKKMQLVSGAKDIRDALVSGDPRVLEKAWETTGRGAIESLRKDISKASLLSRVLMRFRSARADIGKAQEVIKGYEPSIEELEWQQVEGDCMVAFLQAGNRTHVREGIANVLSGVALRLDRREKPNREIVEKALHLADVAIKPVRPDLLYHVNRVIGPASAR